MQAVVAPATDEPTRDRILAAAASALSTRGYARTHLADIARLARLQPPAVYHYFESRDELVAAVMREGQRLVRGHVEAALAALDSDADIAGRFAAAVEAHLRVELELSDFARAVTRNAGHLPPDLRRELSRESREFHDVWRSLLEQAAHLGRLQPGLDLHAGRMLVIGALNWATEWWRPHIPVDAVVTAAQRLVAGGLLQPSAAPVPLAGASRPD